MSRLAREERGAIMLLGLFMAVFLTAIVYYVAGIGEAILQREHMQDAADAAAFAAATLHARGMNLLVLLNMVMAALLAVLVALKLVQTLLTIALVIISVASFWLWGLAATIPEVESARQEVQSIHDNLEPPINTALKALHIAGQAVRTVVPALSEARVIDTVIENYRPTVSFGAAVPPSLTLPTQDGKFSELCDRAGGYVGTLVTQTLGPVIPSPVKDKMADAVGELTSGGADWFCGTSGASPPTATVSHDQYYPQLSSRLACEAQDPSSKDYDVQAHTATCKQAELDEHSSMPDKSTGACVGGAANCGSSSPYEQRDAAARVACAPRNKHDDRLRGFTWQERHFSRTYAFSKGEWHIKTENDSESFRYMEGPQRPCTGRSPRVGPQWNVEQHIAGSHELQPVCTNAEPPNYAGREGDEVTVSNIEVLRLFGCMESYKRTYTLSQDNQKGRVSESASDDGDKKVPQVLLPGIELGDDDFQLRAVVVGRLPPHGPEGVMHVATWRSEQTASSAPDTSANTAPKSSNESPWAAVRALGQLAVAQAEFYYAVEDPKGTPREDYMWNMRWKARLRRFRMPGAGASDTQAVTATPSQGADAPHMSLQSACSAAENALADTGKGASPCSALTATLSDLIVH